MIPIKWRSTRSRLRKFQKVIGAGCLVNMQSKRFNNYFPSVVVARRRSRSLNNVDLFSESCTEFGPLAMTKVTMFLKNCSLRSWR